MRRRNFMIGALLAAFAARASAATPAAPRRLAVFEPAVPAASWRRGPFGEAMLDQLSVATMSKAITSMSKFTGRRKTPPASKRWLRGSSPRSRTSSSSDASAGRSSSA